MVDNTGDLPLPDSFMRFQIVTGALENFKFGFTRGWSWGIFKITGWDACTPNIEFQDAQWFWNSLNSFDLF